MSKNSLGQSREENNAPATIWDEVDQWFSLYFQAFIDIGAGKIDPDKILTYWGVPLHSCSPGEAKWLTTSEEVVGVLRNMQSVLKQIGYTHTVAIEKKITIYNGNAGRVETIMSRRGVGDVEVDRAAVSFELRRQDDQWIIISTTSTPTKSAVLRDVW